MTEHTQIRISTDTRDALKEIGNMSDTYDTLICKMINLYKPYMVALAKRETDRNDPDDSAH